MYEPCMHSMYLRTVILEGFQSNSLIHSFTKHFLNTYLCTVFKDREAEMLQTQILNSPAAENLTWEMIDNLGQRPGWFWFWAPFSSDGQSHDQLREVKH